LPPGVFPLGIGLLPLFFPFPWMKWLGRVINGIHSVQFSTAYTMFPDQASFMVSSFLLPLSFPSVCFCLSNPSPRGIRGSEIGVQRPLAGFEACGSNAVFYHLPPPDPTPLFQFMKHVNPTPSRDGKDHLRLLLFLRFFFPED